MARAAEVNIPHKISLFDPAVFLSKAGLGRTIVQLKKKQVIFAQGDPADAVYYIQRGRIRLTVISSTGKEATLSLLGPGDFVGEACIAGAQPLRMTGAAAIAESAVLKIDRNEMMRALQQEHALSDIFVSYLLTRNARIQEDLVDQLFNSSEKRLARILLLLAQFGKDGTPTTIVPKMTQEVLAEMVGTTRARVNFFLNRFRKLGFIEYNGELHVNPSLLAVILHD
jgi:CRP-like cAMP-binding protein